MIRSSKDDRNGAATYHPWTTYIDARAEATRRGDRRVGTEHLVLALLMEPPLSSALGRDLDAARAALEQMDREALATLGLDARFDAPPLPAAEPARAPRRPTLKAVLRGRLPLTPVAKTVLQESSREMRRPGRDHPGPQRVLDELLRLRAPDPAAELFTALGVDPVRAAERLERLQ